MAAPSVSPKAQIFISYKRNVEPDHSLATSAFEALQKNGYGVFIDRTLTVGQEWARAIEEKVRSSDFLIVFLTAASSASEMVKGELEIARDEAAKSGKGPRILPVRVAFAGPLPYPVSAWLDPLQYAFWNDTADTDRVISELTAAVGGGELSASHKAEPILVRESAPLYSAPLPPPGGGLDIDDPWYIRRTTDDVATRTMMQQGVTLVIKGSRQMGKTSLLVRTLSQAMDGGKRCALVDFQMLGQESLVNSCTFFQRFASAVAESLELQTNVAGSWDKALSDSQNLTSYMEKEILRTMNGPVVLAIDEADFLFQADFVYDFFGMLRSWHNRRATPIPAKRKLWKQLDLVLVTSTEPYLFIDRDHESPFNVGEVIPLADFTLEQVQKLNQLHASPFAALQVNDLYELLHGQPYLTRKALYVVKSGTPPAQLFSQASEDTGPFGDHLRNYFLRLPNYPDVSAALKQVALGRGCSDPRLAYRLQSAGLVKSEEGKIVPRCKLYAQYFRDRL